MSLAFNEGDRVQYKIDLSKEAVSEGTIQKVLRGGESMRESSVERSNIVPRYIIEDELKHTYETFTGDHLIKKVS